MRKITIYDYIASSVPADAYALIKSNGYPKPRNHHDLVAELKDYVKQNGESALMEIGKIHPDRELISQCNEEEYGENNSSNESNNSSPSLSETKSFMNATGDATNISQSTQETINMSKLMIYGSFVLIGLALVLKTSNK
jgi:hypothetical protein